MEKTEGAAFIDAGLHERLHELALEQHEGQHQRADGQQRAGRQDAQSTPVSGAANKAMPTVTGRLASVCVATSGHRKLFQ